MNDTKQYPKNLLWRNTKKRVYEPIPEMDARELSYKLDFLTSKLDKLKLNQIFFQKLRKTILTFLAEKGKVITSIDDRPERYIFLNGDEKEPIIVNRGGKQEEGLDFELALKLELLIRIEKTEFEEDL